MGLLTLELRGYLEYFLSVFLKFRCSESFYPHQFRLGLRDECCYIHQGALMHYGICRDVILFESFASPFLKSLSQFFIYTSWLILLPVHLFQFLGTAFSPVCQQTVSLDPVVLFDRESVPQDLLH